MRCAAKGQDLPENVPIPIGNPIPCRILAIYCNCLLYRADICCPSPIVLHHSLPFGPDRCAVPQLSPIAAVVGQAADVLNFSEVNGSRASGRGRSGEKAYHRSRSLHAGL